VGEPKGTDSDVRAKELEGEKGEIQSQVLTVFSYALTK
jgi:hypothetical protein